MMIQCKMSPNWTIEDVLKPTSNSTRSLFESQAVFTEIHGRRYCGEYYMPIDVIEQTRLLLFNDIYYELFNNRHTTVPLQDPQKILDIGTGTGEWAMAMGEEYPAAEVIGVDIAKIQPDAPPLNVFFETDDAEREWTRAEVEFDLVHFRYMSGAFKDWREIYRETYRCLKPGGWIEVIDFNDHAEFLKYFGEDSEARRWITAIREGYRKSGRPRTAKHLEPGILAELGFTDVTCKTLLIPLGPWRDDKEGQTMGKHFLVATVAGTEAFGLRSLLELGWEYAEIKRMSNIVKDAMWETALDPEKSKGMGLKVKVLTGRKPWTGEEMGGSNKEAEDASTPKKTT